MIPADSRDQGRSDRDPPVPQSAAGQFDHPQAVGSRQKTAAEGAQFKITYADGSFLPDENGKLSSNGLYWSNSEGQIILSGVTGTVVATEVQSVPGYTIDPETQSQTVVVNPDDTQHLWFYNDPEKTLILQKYIYDGDKNDQPLAGVEISGDRLHRGLCRPGQWPLCERQQGLCGHHRSHRRHDHYGKKRSPRYPAMFWTPRRRPLRSPRMMRPRRCIFINKTGGRCRDHQGQRSR